MSSTDHAPIRSYQRIFRPERRIYQVEGHRLPVPGGVPLRWLGYALGGLGVSIVLAQRSVGVALVLAAGAMVAGLAIGGRATALVVGAIVLGGAQVAGFILSSLDWPLRLIVLPAFTATLATQATPDGRPAHRYAASWLALQIRPARRSLGRPVPDLGERRDLAAPVWVRPDAHTPVLRAFRLNGPAVVRFRVPVTVTRGRVRARRLRAELSARRASHPRAARTNRVELAAGEAMEMRP